MDGMQINYSPSLSQRRPAIRRGIALGIASVLAIAAGLKCAPAAWRHGRLLYWQHKLMTYRQAPEQIVYESPPPMGAASTGWKMTAGNGAAIQTAGPWGRFYELWNSNSRNDAAPLFLHERINGRGESRLIALEGWRGFGNGRGFSISTLVIRPGSAVRSPKTLDERSAAVPDDQISSAAHVRFFAGQPDPADLSHFTISYEADGRRGRLDGWLRDDDTVKLEFRTAAALRSVWP